MSTPMKTLVMLGLLLATTTPASSILTPASSITTLPNRLCQERYLQLTCECDRINQVLNVTSFQNLNIHSNVNRITIQNCLQVYLGRNCVDHLRSLRHLEIVSVENLVLGQSALTWTGYEEEFGEQPSLNIIIRNSRVSKVNNFAINGAQAEIRLEGSQFDLLESFAFASLSNLFQISIQHCEFKVIHSQAFKGIQTDKFIINNSSFKGILTSSAFRDIDVKETFTISNSRIDVVKPNAFIVKQPQNFEIINSYFNTLEAESFLVRTRGAVTIKNNHFNHLNERAFMGISLIKESKTSNQELIFTGNSLNDIKNWITINRTSFTPKFGDIFLNQSCSCVQIEVWLTNNEIFENIYCVNDTLRHTSIQAEIFRKRVCETGAKTWVILVSVFSVLLVLLIAAIIVIVLVYRKYKARKQKEYVNRGHNKTGSVGLIVPDGRTYRETEVHVIVEKAELLTTEL